MPVVKFPYGKDFLELDIPESRYAGTLVSDMHHYNPGKTQEQLVQEALEHPVGTPRLCEMARGKKKVVIIASDHTRPVPSKMVAPLMLAEIRRGNPDADITFLISTGCHRETTKEELINKFGEEIVKNEKIYIHDCDDESMLVNLGKLPSGGDLIVNPGGGRGRPSGGGGLHRAAFLRGLLRRKKEHPARHRFEKDGHLQP